MKKRIYNCLLCLIILFLVNFAKAQSVVTVTAKSATVSDGKIVISFVVPSDNGVGYDIQSIEVISTDTKEKIIPKKLNGSSTRLYNGEHSILWDYKSDNFFVEGNFKIVIYLSPCKDLTVNNPNKTLNTHSYIKTNRLGLKIATGVIGITSLAIAQSIKSNFDNKVSIVNSLDTSVNGVFYSQSDYNNWNNAYRSAEEARKTGLLNTLVITSIIAFSYETFLLTTKTIVKSKGLVIQPSDTNVGISINYKF